MKFMKRNNPVLLLLGIGVSNLGAWVYLIALNLIVLDITGSPLAVSILYILIPVATLFTNFWAGSFIDRLNKRNLMISLDMIRAMLIFALPFMESIVLIYAFVFVINIASSVFGPTSMVYMTKLIPIGDRQRFNALRNFINSCGFILGPSIAGFLFMFGTPYLAIQLNSIALVISAVVILLLPNLDLPSEKVISEKVSIELIANDWKKVISFSKSNHYVALVYVLFSGIIVFMTALDSLEAVFATEVLSLSESTYGFLVSVAGIGIIAGSLVNALFAKHLKLNILIGVGAVFTPGGYLIFAFSYDFIWAAVGFLILTFALSFANIGFLTFYQNNIPVEIMGRFSSVFGMVEALLIIVFTTAIGLFAELFDIRVIYIIGSFAFLFLGVVIYMIVMNKPKRNYYNHEVVE